MENADILVVGAGASGLLAALQLARFGKKVLILEANDRIGGRIYTGSMQGFADTIEGGAEFIHGNLPVTFNLAKEAGLEVIETAGEWLQVAEGKLSYAKGIFDFEDEVVDRIKELKTDLTIDELLATFFSDEKYAACNYSLKRFVQGYDAADTSKASAFAFLEEWEKEDEEQYRIKGGYGALLHHLLTQIQQHSGELILSAPVTQLEWQHQKVIATSMDGRKFSAAKAIITIPLGVWQSLPGAKGHIQFTPSLPQKIAAAAQMGFSGVIKIQLAFKEDFWRNNEVNKERNVSFKKMGFALTDAFFPTWWTQLPEKNNLLTGWLAGPPAVALKNATEEFLISKALESLSYIFQLPQTTLRNMLQAATVFNWTSTPYAHGAYAYNTVQTKKVIKEMMQPVENTLFFAGEALYEGNAMGTVEAALISGSRAADEALIL